MSLPCDGPGNPAFPAPVRITPFDNGMPRLYSWGMRTTLNIDNNVYKVAKSIARARDISIGRALSELAMKGLEKGYGENENGEPSAFRASRTARLITPEDVKWALNKA